MASNEENDLSDSPPSLAPLEAVGRAVVAVPGFDLDPTNDDVNVRRKTKEKLRRRNKRFLPFVVVRDVCEAKPFVKCVFYLPMCESRSIGISLSLLMPRPNIIASA